jgi:hypothetical protein
MQAVKERSALTLKEYRYDLVLFFSFPHKRPRACRKDTPFNEISIQDIDEAFLQVDHNG